MKYVILAALLFSSSITFAQDNKGTIIYEEVIKLDIELEGDMAAFAAMMPKETKSKNVLYFTDRASLYTGMKDEEKPQAKNQNGMNIMINMDQPDEVTYNDLEEKKTYQQKEFMSRKFLITGDIKQQKWKMTGKQKEFLGYPCQQAQTVNDEDTILAWFTPAIPVASGPRSMGTLPGMILEVQIGKLMTITAKDVNIGDVDNNKLVKPKGGKKVTNEQYAKIVKEKTKEMEEQFGTKASGDGKRVIMQYRIER